MARRWQKKPKLFGGDSKRNARGRHTRNPEYDAGNHWLICDVCGCDVRSKEAKLRWDNMVVCPDDWEPRQEQDFVRARKDNIAAEGLVRTNPGDDFDSIRPTCFSNTCTAGYAQAGCAVVGDYSVP